MNRFPPPSSAPAGWYPDPYTGGRRYFDGRVWVGAPVLPTPTVAARQPHPQLPLVAAIGALAVLALSLVGGKIVVDALVGEDWPLVVYIAIVSVISYGPSIAWLFYVRARWGSGRFSELGWRFRWSDLGWGPLTWLGTLMFEIAVVLVIVALDIPFTSNIDLDEPGTTDRTYVVALLVAAVLAAPVVEELIFRGIVLRGFLSRMHPVMAVLAQGLLFGVAHVDPVRGVGNVGLAAALSATGVALGAAAYWFRRIGAVVIAHAILNAVALALALSGVLDDIDNPFEALFAMLPA